MVVIYLLQQFQVDFTIDGLILLLYNPTSYTSLFSLLITAPKIPESFSISSIKGAVNDTLASSSSSAVNSE